MSATITPYGRGLLLSAFFLADLYVPPAGLWLAYTRDPPVSNSDGSQLDEPTSGYARAPIGTLTSDNWAFTGFAEVYNTNVIAFDAATDDWGLITGWAVCDSEDPETGNCVMVGTQLEPIFVPNADAPTVDIGGLCAGLYD